MPSICIVDGCAKQSRFGKPGSRAGTHCAKHKPHGYIDVVNKRCVSCQIKQPNFGLDRSKPPSHCKACASEDMFDVVHKRCVSCQIKHPVFGLDRSKPPSHCKACASEDMFDVVSKRCVSCQIKHPVFGLDRSKPGTHCKACASEDMFNVQYPKCASDHCDTKANPKYDGYCTHCFRHLFPNDPRARNVRSKTREIIVRDHLIEHFDDAFIHNQTLFLGCDCAHRRSVDFRVLIHNTMLAIEVDEGKHASTSYREDEVARYNDLSVAFGGKWVFIRFNPDTYVNARGTRVHGFFDSKGNRRAVEIKRRLDILNERVRAHMHRIERGENSELLEVEYLFYDGDELKSS